MFGYIRVDRNELRLREYEYYRATYCGLCRSMGKCTGQCSRMTISYDIAFLASVRLLFDDAPVQTKRRGCLVHPFRKRAMMEPNDALRFAANASAILAYEKCRDDIRDERGAKRLKARMRAGVLRRGYKKASKALPELAQCVRAHLARLNEAEHKRAPSVDGVSSVFGELLADVFAHGLEGNDARLASKIGYEVGRFIYVLDALDDLDEDEKRGRFNPFLLLYGGIMSDEEKHGVRNALVAGLYDLERVFDLLPERDDPTGREILNNILYLGMPEAIDKVLAGHKEDKK